ncbi:hypothetical protein PV10_02923 [Exophiala mesophila]|uniref:Ribonuclease H2 subunit B n=1 Tax=Exophiala mesophila TaxID=212818 RepID=A0A0D2A8C9_EXOME|nr:uncharacterized protein PV10_02923 [Exophiala mesophila]KIV95248.1 hypothetical protein PV10_02923 [Exophiala mesophila]
MAISTRSQTNSPVKKTTTAKPPPADTKSSSLKHFILPTALSDKARFLVLNHPQSSTPERFLFCPERGLFQFTKVTSQDPHSILLAGADAHTSDEADALSKGHISKAAELFVAAPFDLAFILLALLRPSSLKSNQTLFHPLDDILEQHIQENRHLRYIFNHGRPLLESAMAKFCDSIDAGDEQMFRPSDDKTIQMLMQKVDSVIKQGLPASLEDKFVKRKLDIPLLSVKREDTTLSSRSDDQVVEDSSPAVENADSQSSTASTAPSTVFSEVSVTATTSSTSSDPSDDIPEKLYHSQKQNVVLDFILVSYFSDTVAEHLKSRMRATNSAIDFTSLDEHLKRIASMKLEAASARSIGDFSRKRGLDDDEAAELREEKRRKQEEDEKKKKAGESRGVRDLKKVNVTGMKKMSDFFAKKPVGKVKG